MSEKIKWIVGTVIAVLAAGGGVVGWHTLMRANPSCRQFQTGREASVACNSHTANGYFWKVIAKKEHWGEQGVSHSKDVSVCDHDHLGDKAMSAIHPLVHRVFEDVFSEYSRSGNPTIPDCSRVGRDGDPSRAERRIGPSDDCGVFVVECQIQPR